MRGGLRGCEFFSVVMWEMGSGGRVCSNRSV